MQSGIRIQPERHYYQSAAAKHKALVLCLEQAKESSQQLAVLCSVQHEATLFQQVCNQRQLEEQLKQNHEFYVLLLNEHFDTQKLDNQLVRDQIRYEHDERMRACQLQHEERLQQRELHFALSQQQHEESMQQSRQQHELLVLHLQTLLLPLQRSTDQA